MRARFAKDGYLPAEGPLCYTIEQLAVRVIALDSLVEGKPWGELGEEQIAWLDARLAQVPDKPSPHRSIQSRFAATLALTAPSCAHQAELLFGDARGGWICEPPAVLLHYWDAADGLASHISMIGSHGPKGRCSEGKLPVSWSGGRSAARSLRCRPGGSAPWSRR